jgi:hypothetical protein
MMRRFQHQGAVADLDESNPMMQEATEMIAEDNKEMPKFLVALGTSFALVARYQRTEKLTDLEESISIFQKSIGLTLEGDPSLPERRPPAAFQTLKRLLGHSKPSRPKRKR